MTDPDNDYPADFTLSLAPGENYTVAGSTVTPLSNFNGSLDVPATVNDGELDSAPFVLLGGVNVLELMDDIEQRTPPEEAAATPSSATSADCRPMRGIGCGRRFSNCPKPRPASM